MQKAIFIFLIVLINTTISFGQKESDVQKILQLDSIVKVEWAKVENGYQKRSDLIPNLINLLNDIPNFDKKTIIDIVEARAKISSLNISPNNLSQENIDSFQIVLSKLSAALSRLLVTVEQYPQLTNSQEFRDFTIELAGIENRINRNRYLYNEAVKAYNYEISKFPGNEVAAKFHFKPIGIFTNN